jgi:hypothetical protein
VLLPSTGSENVPSTLTDQPAATNHAPSSDDVPPVGEWFSYDVVIKSIDTLTFSMDNKFKNHIVQIGASLRTLTVRASAHADYILSSIVQKIDTSESQSLYLLAGHDETRQMAPLFKLIKVLHQEYQKLVDLLNQCQDKSQQIESVGDVKELLGRVHVALASVAAIDSVFGTVDPVAAIGIVSANNMATKLHPSLLQQLQLKASPPPVCQTVDASANSEVPLEVGTGASPPSPPHIPAA